ncbi:MAG: nucleotide exchange factor GrpE [Candidatus Bipolaricaulota bacterium]|nr:nucleotide exchange factor GrpE [Candidatus Bipolaricaulota bacterium]
MSKRDTKLQEQDVDREEEKQQSAESEKSASLDDESTAKEEEIRSYIDRLQRMQAEFNNYKKRMSREIGQLEQRIIDREVLDFIPLYDNLQRAFSNYSDETNAASFIAGVEKIFAQFDQILKGKGVTPIPAEGQAFDPSKHEALLSRQSSEEKNTVLEEFERGYERNGRVLRPCKVGVSKGVQDTEEKEEEL